MIAANLPLTNRGLSEAVIAVFTEAAQVLKPPPAMTVTQWAEKFMLLSREDSAEGGTRYRSARAPYQAEMQDVVLDPRVQLVTFMTSAQVGKTLILKNILGYFAKEDPASIAWMVPTLDLAKKVATQRIGPMFRDVPALNGVLGDGSRKHGNSMLERTFAGGVLFLVGANSPASMSSMPIRIVITDEVDRFPRSAGPEGDPILLIGKRQTTYWNRKRLHASTPTLKGSSRIDALYEDSDMRKYWVPCPHCNEAQLLLWRRRGPEGENYHTVKCPKGEEPTVANTYYVCEHCGVALTEFDKPKMLAGGQWRAEHPERIHHAGFWLNEMYSPFTSWAEMLAAFRAATGHRENPEELKTFVNLALAETYEERENTITKDVLEDRIEGYGPTLPDKVTVLTAGVDVQEDRIELEVVGWGLREESWSIDVARFEGNTAKPEIWQQLDEYLQRKWRHARGVELGIVSTFIDSGYRAKTVYAFTKDKWERRIFASKGMSGWPRPAVAKWNRNNESRVRMYPVGVDVLKDLVYARMKIEKDGPGYMHYTRSSRTQGELPVNDSDYFAQMTSEQIKSKNRNGYPMRYWFLPPGARNEALDCRVYATAALLALSPSPTKMLERLREELVEWAKEYRSKHDPNQLSLLPEAELPEDPAEEKAAAAEIATVEPVAEVENPAPVAAEQNRGEIEPSRTQSEEQNSEPPIRVRKSRWV
jgi:phage terminase large subunit GpA-like protein